MSKFRNVIIPSKYGPMIINRHDGGVGNEISKHGVYSQGDIDVLTHIIKMFSENIKNKKSVVLDIGANIGAITLALASIPNTEIHSFEAQRKIFLMLAGTIAINSLDNVFVYNLAVSDVTGEEINFPSVDYSYPSNFGAVHIGEARFYDFDNKDFGGVRIDGEMESVTSICIDDLKLNNVNLIKVDVEGMEDMVFVGAQKTLERCKPIIFWEYLKTDSKSAMQYLEKLGYTHFKATKFDILSVPKELESKIHLKKAILPSKDTPKHKWKTAHPSK